MSRLNIAALTLVLVISTGPLFASAALNRGLADGRKFGHEAGQQKGALDGKTAGEAAGFAKGMEDERTHQPPPGGGSQPPSPPSTGAGHAQALASETEAVEQLGQTALTRYPDLMPRATALTTAPAGDSNQDGIDYSKGFALGLAAGFAETYPAARSEAYEKAFPDGYARGRAEYRRLYRRDDGSTIGPKDQYQLGRQALLLNRFQEAIERFDIAIAAEGAGDVIPQALYYKAKTYFDWDKPREALDPLVKLLAGYADSAAADYGYFLAGACYEKLPADGLSGFFGSRRYAQARDAYRTLTLKYPQSALLPDGYFRLGFTCEKLGDRHAAFQAYFTLVEKFPHHPLADKARERLQHLRG